MKAITFIDTEVSEETRKILDFGVVKQCGESIHTASSEAFLRFIQDSEFICGHNILLHDLVILKSMLGQSETMRYLGQADIVDTLPLSPLLFPQRPYHALVKDDKLQSDELNNPLSDAKKAMDLFFDEVSAFQELPKTMKVIFFSLLKEQTTFSGFFRYIEYEALILDVEHTIRGHFHGKICEHASLAAMIMQHPVELAYCLALIHADDEYAITPPWILHRYPETDRLMRLLRGEPCLHGCIYCSEQLDAVHGLKRFFGYDAYRTFEGIPLQEQAVKAAIANQSLLAVFPTGGGKSITFQVPALQAGKTVKGLTVVISPLQSLMKDQIDNLERINVTDAVTVNGLLDPIERAVSLRRVEDGEATILYISPESLRSKTIERLLLNRKIVRFVIDEAHCFSSWGQDFRVDYLYIADFIRNLCVQKNLDEMIPVSCFTATAKQNVIDDIRTYFKEKLNLELILFTASSARKNLHYRVVEKSEDAKIEALRGLLDAKPCPTIVYVSRTKKASELADRLTRDGYPAKPYHGKMDKKEKSENQDSFLHGESRIMVATSAFGMGVDKKDIGLVIHYDISDSLENYVQEAGRAGRDQQITADCYVLFNDEDLNKHFLLLNQTRISQQEIQQVWKAIKDATRTRSHMSSSALEIAREAGWDKNVLDVETCVKTAIAALEEAGYVKRGQNMPRIYADGILARNAMEAIEKIRSSPLISDQEQERAIRIIKKLIASRSRLKAKDDAPQSRVDCIADDLGLEKHQVLHTIQLLREAKILADSKDLTGYLDETGSAVRSMHALASFRALEAFLLRKIPDEKTVVNIKELNECAETEGMKKVTPDRIQTVMNFWTVQGVIKREVSKHSQHLFRVTLQKKRELLAQEIEERGSLAGFILEYLEDRNAENARTIEFSILEIKEAFNQELMLGKKDVNTDEIEQALFYLSRIGAMKLDGGFLVTYNGLSLERLVLDNKTRYKAEDYQNLKRYYDQKTQMIHIVGEYARKMMENYQTALQFVEDYFQLEYSSFLRKYFKGSKGEEIRRNLTPEKFRKIFGELSVSQLKIINDKESQYIVVAAGPGSGKTKTLVHKLASLLLMEDVKHEQLLMVTFSRAAATEFKKRLQALIGNAAHFVEIKTFHSYCFDLLGRVGNLEKSVNIVEEATDRIRNGDVESSKITKTVLVIDEAQDVDEHEYALIQALIRKNDDMRVIAVGDDDQNIFAFRGSDSKYMQALLNLDNARLHELVENYRSRRNLVEFSNIVASSMKNRLKTIPIMPVQQEMGQIRVIRYECRNLIVPVVTKMLAEGMKGSTCILTKTNDEALQVCSLMHMNGVHAKLIQSMERYALHDLLEVRFFLDSLHLTNETYILHEDIWEGAKDLLKRQFVRSRHLPMCLQLIQDFEATNKKYKYKSDLLTFIHESQEEDFLMIQNSSIFVSTMHKAKGREFDHVVLLLNRFPNVLEESKRLLYVAMTRARLSLTVHCNDDIFGNPQDSDYLHIEGLRYERDAFRYESSNRIIVQLTYNDVHLDFFFSSQQDIRTLIGGDTLAVDEEGCLVNRNQRILRFSKKFQDDISVWRTKGYRPCAAKVNHILYWKKEGEEQEILVLFPEMEFLREP